MFIAQIPAIQIPADFPPAAIVGAAEIISCPAVTTFMKLGWSSNDPKEVANLQSVLKNVEQINVDVTGVFDERTDEAVKVFQRKYMSEVMAPWGATRPSGIVNITTAKKINHVACQIPMTLSQAELSKLSAYRMKLAASTVQPEASVTSFVVPIAPTSSIAPVVPVAPAAPIAPASSGTSEAGVSIPGKFGQYIKGLFR